MDFPDRSVSPVDGGHIAQIDGQGRLAIPASVLRALGWQAMTKDLLAELRHTGCVRIFGSDRAAEAVRAHRANFQNLDAQEALEFEQVLADRYRTLKIYGDGRLTITREIVALLGVVPGEAGKLFVQTFDSGLSVISLDFRSQRLADHDRFPPIPLHLLQALT